MKNSKLTILRSLAIYLALSYLFGMIMVPVAANVDSFSQWIPLSIFCLVTAYIGGSIVAGFIAVKLNEPYPIGWIIGALFIPPVILPILAFRQKGAWISGLVKKVHGIGMYRIDIEKNGISNAQLHEIQNAKTRLRAIRDPRWAPYLMDNFRYGSLQEIQTALTNMSDPVVTDLLIAFLKNPDQNIRANVALTLGDIGDPRAVQPLEEALNDPDSDVRTAAQAAIARLKLSRGGFGEPYCSEECKQKGGKHAADIMLQNQTGECGFCSKPVTASMHGNLECGVVPYQGKTLYICNDCGQKAKEYFKNYYKCCLCQKEL